MMNWQVMTILMASGALMALGLVVGVVAVALAFREKKRELPADQPAITDLLALETPSQQDEVTQLVGQLQELTDEIDQRIEGRLDQLAGLLADADNKLLQARQTGQAPQGSFPAEASPAVATGQYHAQRPAADFNRHKEVIRLSEQGLQTVEIARRVGMNTGEIELIVNLASTKRNI